MDNPNFFLEGIVKEKNQLQDFEGPLSLILMLLSKNKIEIRDIKIADILDQYLEYLDKMQSMDLEVASEFVQMASHLLYIKTRTLLAGDEEVSELEVLMASLEQLKCRDIFAAVQKVTPELKKASELGLLYYAKLPEPLQFLDYENRVYSPGAMVFVPEPDGTGLWGIFHVKLYPDIGYSHRVLFAQPLTFVDDVPTMEAPQPLGTVYTMKKNTMPLASRIGSFDRTGTVSPAPDPFPVTTAEPDPGTDVPVTEPTNPSGSSSILLPLTVGAVLLAVGAVVAAVLILGKKKKK